MLAKGPRGRAAADHHLLLEEAELVKVTRLKTGFGTLREGTDAPAGIFGKIGEFGEFDEGMSLDETVCGIFGAFWVRCVTFRETMPKMLSRAEISLIRIE